MERVLLYAFARILWSFSSSGTSPGVYDAAPGVFLPWSSLSLSPSAVMPPPAN
jgi:hypothetical protein